MSEVVVIGETGQLAKCFHDLASQKGRDFRFVNRALLDLSNPSQISAFFANSKPRIILNLAAYTQVDKAETEKELALSINALASKELARSCEKYFYVSTDYVYDGTGHRPYVETDPTAPINYYGVTKLQGELLAQQQNANTHIIRTSWVYSPYGVNFVKRIAELASARPQLKIVADQLGSPTWAPDLADAILSMVDSATLKPGIYHYSNEGACSWYDFAKEIVIATGANCEILPIKTEEYPTPAKRPHYSVLDKSKIKTELKLTIPHWKASFEKNKLKLFP